MKKGEQMTKKNTAELIVEMLEEAGGEYIFCIPGGATEDLNIALHKTDKIKPIVTKHEQGAAFIADGYARVSGKLGICCATAGPGASNLITGIASAFSDSIPILALTGQVATSVFGKGAVQESGSEGVNITSIFRNFTKYSGMLINEQRAPFMVEKAIKLASSSTGRPGPVHLSLPADVMKKPAVQREKHTFSVHNSRLFSRDGVNKAAEILLNAKRPAIIVGWGVALSRAADELYELATLLNIPVATSPKAKGTFPENEKLSLGVLGFAGSPVAKEYIVENDIDVLLAVGTSFNEMMTSGWDERLKPTECLIQIDIDDEIIGKNYLASIDLVGDARAALEEILHSAERIISIERNKLRKSNSPRLNRKKKISDGVYPDRLKGTACKTEITKLKKKHHLVPVTNFKRAGLYNPRALVEDIQKNVPENSIYFADIGTSMAWAIRYLNMKNPYSFFVALGFCSMGYAVAAPVGAKLAFPDRPIIALVGDGSFLMNGTEVATAVNYGIPVVWVVFNNSMLGMVHHGRKLFETPIPEGIPSGFKQVDFAKMAEGMGARGITIKGPKRITRQMMNGILAKGQSTGIPTVIDVHIDEKAVPPIHSRIETVDKHFG